MIFRKHTLSLEILLNRTLNIKNAKIHKHLYATLYQKFYSRYNNFGAQNQSIFELCSRTWIKNKKIIEARVSCNQKTFIKQPEVAKNPENHKQRPALGITEFEQVVITGKY